MRCGVFPVGSQVQLIPGNPYGDINLGQLAQRSLIALRKFFPRVIFSSQAPVFQPGTNVWYDFNGNGVNDSAGGAGYILQGHQCLVFFLGGVPTYDSNTQTYGVSGFGKDPTNPFTNNIPSFAMYNPNRQPAFYDFNGGRLFQDPLDVGNQNIPTVPSLIPGYYDSLGNNPPGVGANNTLNFFVYFSGYGNGVYDPNDVNWSFESDAYTASPIGLNFLYSTSPFISPARTHTQRRSPPTRRQVR